MTMGLPRYRPTPRNMVQEVRNIVEGYRMGPLRALAQDPVQNSYDAKRPGISGPVLVDYCVSSRKLESGEPMYLLTVTDRNTTGLAGPVISPEDLQQRAESTGYLQLLPNENWAAWEAMGYTKIEEDALGSRGQGKASFLYHSRDVTGLRGPGGHYLERMIILYDTLLVDGTYRLGARLARPDDVVLYPPYEGEEAKRIVGTMWTVWETTPIPLYLEPLSDVGTRVIVPYLSSQAVDALRNGDMIRWLERCWWRAIQLGELQITVTFDSNRTITVGVPEWWRNEPWRQRTIPDNMRVFQDVPLQSGSPRKIKRIVLLHQPGLPSDEILGVPSQYSGLQLMRHRQWIETLGARQEFPDYIPMDKRAGFRGFVEFDQRLDRQLREEESSQHDFFKRHKTWVRQIDFRIRDAVREFAESQGWTTAGREVEQDDRGAHDILNTVLETFLPGTIPGRGRQSTIAWECQLEVDFPRSDSSRIEWGEPLRNIAVSCTHEPADRRRDIAFTLEVVAPGGQSTEIATRRRVTTDGSAGVDFGDVTIVPVAHDAREISGSEPGKYRLRVICRSEGQVVASASRNVYIRTDPPPRTTRPFTVDIAVQNASASRLRINHGDVINVAVTVVNRTSDRADLALTASLESLLLADSTRMAIPGRPEGDAPASRMVRFPDIQVLTTTPDPEPSGRFVVLAPGRWFIRVDVRDSGGTVVANAAKAIFVEVDPEEGIAGAPFVIKGREADEPYPVWELEPPSPQQPTWVLYYARKHPSYVAAAIADQHRPHGTRLYGTKQFWAETFCSALVEWALMQFRDCGDQGGFSLLMPTATDSHDTLWERYQGKVEELMQSYRDALKCLTLQREVASLMIYILSRRPA